jgi:hypothetical protein
MLGYISQCDLTGKKLDLALLVMHVLVITVVRSLPQTEEANIQNDRLASTDVQQHTL